MSMSDTAPPADAPTTLAPPGEPPPAPAPPPRRLGLRITIWSLVLVVVAALVVTSRVNTHDYVLTPGDAQSVAPLIAVPPHLEHPVKGDVLLTDVDLSSTPVSLLRYLVDKLTADAAFVPATTILGPATPVDQLITQGYIEMAQSQAAAKATALTRLGYHVTATDVGVILYSVIPGTPAASKLEVGQIITGVDGRPTTDVCQFEKALEPLGPGDVVRLSVEQSKVTTKAVIVPGPTVTRAIRLSARPASSGSGPTGCPGVPTVSRGYLGIFPMDQTDFTYPIPVKISTTSIGGPSAGLAMTLGIIDKLSSGNLTGGRTVAATGTISPTGAVGAVGGVPQKTVAVERSGASVFFVPVANYPTAKSKDIPSLHVYAVRSLDQVLTILTKLGGHPPPPPAAGGATDGNHV